MVCYAEQVFVNHGVLYTVPSGCESLCGMLSRVVVNHVLY